MLPTAFHTARCKPLRSWLRREAWTPSAPKLWEKGYRHRGTELVLISSFHCIVLFSLSATILIAVDIWFVLLQCNDVLQFCWLHTVCFQRYPATRQQSIVNSRVNQQVKEGQQLEGCKTRLYVQPVAYRDVWRHISQWRPIGLKSGGVHPPQNVCLPIGYLTPCQCRRHPLTTEVSVKMF